MGTTKLTPVQKAEIEFETTSSLLSEIMIEMKAALTLSGYPQHDKEEKMTGDEALKILARSESLGSFKDLKDLVARLTRKEENLSRKYDRDLEKFKNARLDGIDKTLVWVEDVLKGINEYLEEENLSGMNIEIAKNKRYLLESIINKLTGKTE